MKDLQDLIFEIRERTKNGERIEITGIGSFEINGSFKCSHDLRDWVNGGERPAFFGTDILDPFFSKERSERALADFFDICFHLIERANSVNRNQPYPRTDFVQIGEFKMCIVIYNGYRGINPKDKSEIVFPEKRLLGGWFPNSPFRDRFENPEYEDGVS